MEMSWHARLLDMIDLTSLLVVKKKHATPQLLQIMYLITLQKPWTLPSTEGFLPTMMLLKAQTPRIAPVINPLFEVEVKKQGCHVNMLIDSQKEVALYH